jgi:hypothetical protein
MQPANRTVSPASAAAERSAVNRQTCSLNKAAMKAIAKA